MVEIVLRFKQMTKFSQNPQAAKSAPVGGFFDQLKGLGSSVGKSAFEDLLSPLPQEALRQFGVGQTVPKKEQVLFDGAEARKKADKEKQERVNQLRIQNLQAELARIAENEKNLKTELAEISQTVVSIAKSAQIEVPAGVEKVPVKPGIYHKVFYLRVLENMRKKADEAKEWRRTQQVRVTSKPPRGVLIWLGDQKKVHEAGATFLLQG